MTTVAVLVLLAQRSSASGPRIEVGLEWEINRTWMGLISRHATKSPGDLLPGGKLMCSGPGQARGGIPLVSIRIDNKYQLAVATAPVRIDELGTTLSRVSGILSKFGMALEAICHELDDSVSDEMLVDNKIGRDAKPARAGVWGQLARQHVCATSYGEVLERMAIGTAASTGLNFMNCGGGEAAPELAATQILFYKNNVKVDEVKTGPSLQYFTSTQVNLALPLRYLVQSDLAGLFETTAFKPALDAVAAMDPAALAAATLGADDQWRQQPAARQGHGAFFRFARFQKLVADRYKDRSLELQGAAVLFHFILDSVIGYAAPSRPGPLAADSDEVGEFFDLYPRLRLDKLISALADAAAFRTAFTGATGELDTSLCAWPFECTQDKAAARSSFVTALGRDQDPLQVARPVPTFDDPARPELHDRMIVVELRYPQHAINRMAALGPGFVTPDMRPLQDKLPKLLDPRLIKVIVQGFQTKPPTPPRTYELSPETTIGELQSRIERDLKVPTTRQRLWFNSKPLTDSTRPLWHVGVRDMDMIRGMATTTAVDALIPEETARVSLVTCDGAAITPVHDDATAPPGLARIECDGVVTIAPAPAPHAH